MAPLILGMLFTMTPVLGTSTASAGVGGAAFTTTDVSEGTGACLNGNTNGGTTDVVNCNIYAAKADVWLNGGPLAGDIGAGTYFFDVVVPGGQGSDQNPNDGTDANLSDTTCLPYAGCPGPTNGDGSAVPSGDAWTNREFTITGDKTSGYTMSYSGTHLFDAAENKIQLMPYDDTTNPGGEYIMAICAVPSSPSATSPPGVTPSSCKYDAFKVQQGSSGCTPGVNGCPFPPAAAPGISKDATGTYTDTWTWGISKSVDNTKIVTSAGSATFNYTVNVTHDSGTISGVTVAGNIDVTNPNFDSSFNTVPLTLTGVTDQLSDGTVCAVDTSGTVTGTSGLTLNGFDNIFPYTCSLSALPQGELDNTATTTWDDQTLSNGDALAAGSADFTFSNISFAATNVDDCVNVTDTLVSGGTLGSVCQSDASPTTFTYANTVIGTPGTCVTQDNTATFTTNDTNTTGSASKSVQECTPEDLQVSKNATPGFTRTYSWSIAKSASPNQFVQPAGSKATANYTVTVTQTGYTDSGWQASGMITLTNPNDFFDFTGVNVSDAVDDGGLCSVTDGSDVTVPASSSVKLPYTCTYSSQPAYGATATNTATATWDGSTLATPDSTANGHATFTFNDGTSGNPSPVNNCVTVTDTNVTTPLGTDCYGTNPTVQTYTYSLSFTAPAGTCQTFPNTASLSTGQERQRGSVKVCGTQDLKVTKNATPGFTRTFTWSITKGANPTLIEQAGARRPPPSTRSR